MQNIQTQLNNKVDKEVGKTLSSNDYSDTERNKLATLYKYDDNFIRNKIIEFGEVIKDKSGLDGDKGEKGDKGDKGDTGEKGDNGTSVYVSVAEESADTYRLAFLDSKGTIETPNLKGDKGNKGDKGDKGDDGYDDTSIRQEILNLVSDISELEQTDIEVKEQVPYLVDNYISESYETSSIRVDNGVVAYNNKIIKFTNGVAKVLKTVVDTDIIIARSSGTHYRLIDTKWVETKDVAITQAIDDAIARGQIGKNPKIFTSGDLNELTQRGRYLTYNLENAPTGALDNDGFVDVDTHFQESTGKVLQCWQTFYTQTDYHENGVTPNFFVRTGGVFDSDIPVWTPWRKVLYDSDFLSTMGVTGYQKFPSGLVLQWGDFRVDSSETSGDITITFPIAFPNRAHHVFVTDVVSAGSTHTLPVFAVFNVGSATAGVRYDRNGVGSAIYLAIGY